MNYTLKEIKDKETWNNFVFENNFEFYSFLVSWEWGDFQELANKKVLRYGIFSGDEQIGILPLIVNKAKRGTYLFAAHTPLIKKCLNKDYGLLKDSETITDSNRSPCRFPTTLTPIPLPKARVKTRAENDIRGGHGSEGHKTFFFEVLNDILPQLKEIAFLEKADFIRFNSPVKNTISNKKEFGKLGFINAPMHEHAEDTHLLDLTKTEEELLSNIKKDDRYYINRAIKEGVEIRIGNTTEHIELLTKMHDEHSKKVGYHAFTNTFVQNLYKSFGDKITTISASYNGKIESILMTICFGKTCIYYIAASDIVSHKFSPNYLCQWEAIKQAKKSGAKIYNFWGVSPDDNPKHPISGVSKFKRRFGGYDYSLLHAQDLPLTWKYRFNYIIETIRRKKRGYYYKKAE